MIRISLTWFGATHIVEVHESEIKCENAPLKDDIETFVMNFPIAGYCPDADTYYANKIVRFYKGEIIH